jgi:hypothetical protein
MRSALVDTITCNIVCEGKAGGAVFLADPKVCWEEGAEWLLDTNLLDSLHPSTIRTIPTRNKMKAAPFGNKPIETKIPKRPSKIKHPGFADSSAILPSG